MKQSINIYMLGNADPVDSYGQIGLELARHLARMGHYPNIITVGERQMDSQDAEVAAITGRPIVDAPGGIFLGWPPYHDMSIVKGGPRIALTMFESTKPPPDWVTTINQWDALIVPCEFCRDLFAKNGVTVPIYTIPLGLSEIYQYADRPTNRPLTFLAFTDRGKRKGGWTAARAFVTAFGDNPEYQLILKGRNTQLPTRITNDNITVIERDMTQQELYQLYLSADVLINPHRGEGWGLLPREFSATGGVSITTAWSGTADDLEEWGIPLWYELVPARYDQPNWAGLDLGEWAEPDFEMLVNTLRYVADDRESYRKWARGAAARVRSMYSWSRFAAEVAEVWGLHGG